MSVHKILIYTDILVDHLAAAERPSVLRLAMQKFFCYTTVFQAIELFSLSRSTSEREVVEDCMAAMKVLGLNAKNAERYGTLIATHRRRDRWPLLTAGLCLESRLPLLTSKREEFRGVKGLVLVSPKRVRRYGTAEEILRAAKD